MGSSSSTTKKSSQQLIHLQIQKHIRLKHKTFTNCQAQLLRAIAEADEYLQKLPDIKAMVKEIKQTVSSQYPLPFYELESFLKSSVFNSVTNGREFLKSRRKQFFCFARTNVLKHQDFLLARIVSRLNSCAKGILQNWQEQNILASETLRLSICLTKIVIRWLYDWKVMSGVFTGSVHSEHNQNLAEQLYVSQLVEYLLFFQRSSKNYLHRLRFKQIEELVVQLDKQIVTRVRDLRKESQIARGNSFQEESSYDIIINYLEKMAQANLLTTKYKFICIIQEVIPMLFLQNQMKKHKHDSIAKRTFCMTPDQRAISIFQNSGNMFSSFGRNYDLESRYSQLISVDNKRDLLKYLLLQWYKQTKFCIIQDIYLPLQLLLKQGYIDNIQESTMLSAFQHALYELIGVQQDLFQSDYEEQYEIEEDLRI